MDSSQANTAEAFGIDSFGDVDFSQLERSLRRPRTLIDFLLSATVTGMTLLSLIPLFSLRLWSACRTTCAVSPSRAPP